jgi:deoxyadenosine/deoxycytidine kinase
MIVTVGGNIGCGKSTLLENLTEFYTVVPEPVAKWGSWLDLFYTDMKRYGFGFQMKVLLEFLHLPPQNSITERSPLDALYVFGKALFMSDHMSYMEYNLFKDYVHTVGWKPDVYIYLRTDPVVCFERIQKRSRDAENGVTLEYITQIHNMYEKFIEIIQDLDVRVYVVNANFESKKVQNSVNTLLQTFI